MEQIDRYTTDKEVVHRTTIAPTMRDMSPYKVQRLYEKPRDELTSEDRATIGFLQFLGAF